MGRWYVHHSAVSPALVPWERLWNTSLDAGATPGLRLANVTSMSKPPASTVRTRTTITVFAVVVLAAVALVHFGPPRAWFGRDNLLALVTLPTGSQLCVVAHKTGRFAEPYEVNLYRLETNGQVMSYYLGHEDSYWWGCSLSAAAPTPEVQIRCFWQTLAVYSMENDSVAWIDSRLPPSPPRRASAGKVGRLVAKHKE